MDKVDGLILLLGQSGVGKSTFINYAAGKDVAEVCDDYISSTSEVKGFITTQSTSNSPHIMLVDTPGFNDTWLKDVDILAQVIAWLKKQKSVNVYGIIYLYDIVRHTPTGGAGLVTPTNFSQPRLVKNLCLVTVGWTGEGAPRNLQSREDVLKANTWSLMTQAGSHVSRFEPAHESAWNIIGNMIQGTAISLETFIGELKAVHNHLSRHTPQDHDRGLVKGFFSFLFGRKKESKN